MTRKQWVNFPAKDTTILSKKVVRSKYVDGDVESEHVMGPTVYVKVRYKKDGTQVPVTLTVEASKANAKYSETERNHSSGVYGPTIESATGIGHKGVAKFHVKLTPAGGDRYRFKAKSKKGTELVCKDEVETRRKLYYQIIRMKGAADISAADLSLVEKEFWNPAKKVYLKLEQYSPGGTILDLENFDDTDKTVLNRVRDAARAAYDSSKAPFSVAVLIVNKNCIPEWGKFPFFFKPDGGAFHLPIDKQLFCYADPAVSWFWSATFTPMIGKPVALSQASFRPIDPYTLEVDTASLPRSTGNLEVIVRVVDIQGMGLSLPSENLVTVASKRLDGSRVPSSTMAGILVHEIGHKIGMVPGPQGDRDLDEQSSYYHGRGHSGGHCRHPSPLLDNYLGARPKPPPGCTMFGDIRTNTTKFCALCETSLRKLDLSPERKVGIANQF